MRTKLFNFIFSLLTSLIYFMPSNLTAQTKPDIEKLDDAVVLVMIYDYQGNFVGHGSGFIIDNKGTVVTNYHVVKGAYSLKVRVDNNGVKTDYDVENILSGAESKDLAKISLKNPYAKVFPFLPLAKTYPSKGEDCWAIGTPADPKYMNTVSKGLISNIDLNSNPKVLQTNAEITHGSSGGALINSKGEVVGVTSAGDGSDDGARASINFAIWIGELNNLPIINKKSVVDPASIPCQLSFYTNNPYTGSVYLYVDGLYVGYFSKYFLNNMEPVCGAEGTITRNLFAGSHSYMVYYASTNQSFYGTINLTPGQCKIYKVIGPSVNYYNPYAAIFSGRKVFENKNEYSWVIYSGLSFSQYTNYANVPKMPIPILVEKSFKENKFAVRSKIEFFKGEVSSQDYYSSFEPTTSTQKSSYFASITDLKLIWNRKYRFNFWAGPTFGISKFENYNSYFTSEYNFNTGQYENTLVEEVENLSGISYGLRFGFDMYTTKRFYISSDFGVLKYRGLNARGPDLNLILGYRFNAF